jgi:hypothetical protein
MSMPKMKRARFEAASRAVDENTLAGNRVYPTINGDVNIVEIGYVFTAFKSSLLKRKCNTYLIGLCHGHYHAGFTGFEHCWTFDAS